MTPAEHRARAELIATVLSAPEWPEREAAREQLPTGLLDLGWPTMLAAGQLHALLATPFVDPDEIITVDTSDEPLAPGGCGRYWLPCARCGTEYVFSHLCHEHTLCGTCHPAVESRR